MTLQEIAPELADRVTRSSATVSSCAVNTAALNSERPRELSAVAVRRMAHFRSENQNRQQQQQSQQRSLKPQLQVLQVDRSCDSDAAEPAPSFATAPAVTSSTHRALRCSSRMTASSSAAAAVRQQTTSGCSLSRVMVSVLVVALLHSCCCWGVVLSGSLPSIGAAAATDEGASVTDPLGVTNSAHEQISPDSPDDHSPSSGEDGPLSMPPQAQDISAKLFWVMRGKKDGPMVEDSAATGSTATEDASQGGLVQHTGAGWNTNGETTSSVDDHHQGSEMKKREIRAGTNWGSNPYLLGKRRQQSFWAARGKKNVDDVDYADGGVGPYQEIINYALPYLIMTSPSYAAAAGDEDTLDISSPTQMLPNGEAIYNEGVGIREKLFRDRMIGGSKRKDGLFWASRGKRQDVGGMGVVEMPRNIAMEEIDDDSSLEKRSSNAAKLSPLMKEAMMYGKNNDNSKFWMSRGRRFWAARGKKTKVFEPSKFSRLARLVDSGVKDRGSFYSLDGDAGVDPMNEAASLSQAARLLDMHDDEDLVEPPNFWIVRGKKSTIENSDEIRDDVQSSVNQAPSPATMNMIYPAIPAYGRDKKPSFKNFSPLARLRNPNFWASRGRKNFWAARGKRSISDGDVNHHEQIHRQQQNQQQQLKRNLV